MREHKDTQPAVRHGLGEGSKHVDEGAVEAATEASMEVMAVEYLDVEYVHRMYIGKWLEYFRDQLGVD